MDVSEIRGGSWEKITPSDTSDLSGQCNGLLVGTDGSLRIKFSDGSQETIPSGVFSTGIFHPGAIKKVFSTGTTAGDIYGNFIK
jgi:hypothetical protein